MLELIKENAFRRKYKGYGYILIVLNKGEPGNSNGYSLAVQKENPSDWALPDIRIYDLEPSMISIYYKVPVRMELIDEAQKKMENAKAFLQDLLENRIKYAL